VAPLALRHRLRRNVLDETGSGARIARVLVELFDAAEAPAADAAPAAATPA
jgi:hypothetical protein